MLRDFKLDSSSITSNVTRTLFSNCKSITAKHKLQQPRRVLETKLLIYNKNVSFDDKRNKYKFSTLENELLF